MAERDTEMFLKPAPGRLVRHPRSMRQMPEEGERIRGDRFYWHRMIAAGDVVVVREPEPKRPVKKED